MLNDYLSKLKSKTGLGTKESETLCEEILFDDMTDDEIANILISLAEKGETSEEIAGFVNILSKHAEKIAFNGPTVDLCGTGGSGLNRFNVSTAASFVISCRGVVIAKHGNRGSRKPNGSFDLLEELGIPIDLDGRALGKCLDEMGLGFIFARKFHPVMKKVVNARKIANRRTIFNLAGPLCNPTDVKYQIIGTADESKLQILAEAVMLLGRKKAIIVCGEPGIDEVSISGISKIIEVTENDRKEYEIKPNDFAIEAIDYPSLPAGNASENARIFKELVDGSGNQGIRDMVALSSGLVFTCAGATANIESGYKEALGIISSGQMKEKFNRYRDFTIKEFRKV